MFELPKVFPDIDVLLALEPEELAAKILFLIRKRVEREPFAPVHLGNYQGEPFGRSYNGEARYPNEARDKFYLAFSEAWSWLEAQGLLVPAPGMNGSNGFRLLSRRAQKFEDDADFRNFVIARRLPKEALHPKISNVVWQAFIRGEFDVAIFQATKAIEVSVRDATGMSAGLVGVRLMRAAFAPKTGPLTDLASDEGEQVARMELFTGAIGSYKNPHSHRDVNLDDPSEAIEIIMLANHLLRIVDARAKARATP